MKTRRRKEIEYWGTGFAVTLLDFPAVEDEGVFVPDVAYGCLHKLIAHRLVQKPSLLTGAELAFLRAVAGLNRSEAARKLGITRRTLINWEESAQQPIRAPAISHPGIRLLFASWIFPAGLLTATALAGFDPHYRAAPLALTYSDYRAFERHLEAA